MSPSAKKSKTPDTSIASIGAAKLPSPARYPRFISDAEQLTLDVPRTCLPGPPCRPMLLTFEAAGPRAKLYFDAGSTGVAIATCGGLCPGTNDVIRAMVMEGFYNYGIKSMIGVRYGLEGFNPEYGHESMELTPESVSRIADFGGTILGSSRGPQPSSIVVDSLIRMNAGALILIGGDGTMRAALDIQQEIAKRDLRISVIGIPKTIDNDITFVGKSLGFDTAVGRAMGVIRGAHTEALGVANGVGLVKLMGRASGFIATEASLAMREVNFVLIPEYPFALSGPGGLLDALEKRILTRGHAVIVVAEGAGQHLCEPTGRTDPSGNPVPADICGLLRKRIDEHFRRQDIPLTLKYIDPSYILRSLPANSNDRVYSAFLGQNAVHAAMAGKTGMVVAKLQERFVHLPLALVSRGSRRMDTTSDYWHVVRSSTGQDLAREGDS